MTYFSLLRYEDFFTSNWDLGIAMQSLYTTTHGYLMYETGDLMNGGYRSYLEINSAFIGLPVSIIYGSFPGAEFLFAVQSSVVAASAFPLYLIMKDMKIDARICILLSICYLFSFPVLSALLYDFHWEAFIPLEYNAEFLLITRRKWLGAVLTLVGGSLTLEVFPPLVAGIVLFLVIMKFYSGNRIVRDRDTRNLTLLFVLTVATYLAVRGVQALMFIYFPGHIGSHSSAYLPVATFIHPFPIVRSLPLSSIYWLLLLAAGGYFALAAPEYLILSIPWFVESVFLYAEFSTYFGTQYSFIAFPPLFIATAAGLSRVVRSDRTHYIAIAALAIIAVSSAALILGSSRLILSPGSYLIPIFIAVLIVPAFSILAVRAAMKGSAVRYRADVLPRKKSYRMVTALVLSLILLNLTLSPLNTENFHATQYPGYLLRYQLSEAYQYMGKITEMIPRNTTLVTSDNLFPYIANRIHSYALYPGTFNKSVLPYFPFSAQRLPDFLLVSDESLFELPSFLEQIVFNSSFYGIRAYIFENKYPGTIYLFQRNYSGNSALFVAQKEARFSFFTYKDLTVGTSGQVVRDRASRFGYIIESKNGFKTASGNPNYAAVWYGPYRTFLPGRYEVTMSLNGYGFNSSDIPLLYVNSNGFGGSFYYSRYIDSAMISSNGWTNITFGIDISQPYPLTEFRGYLIYSNGKPAGLIQLNYVELEYLG